MRTTAQKNIVYYPCCKEPYPDVTFNITLKRKTLFYTINLITPCVSITTLTILDFYLPSDCGEKISLSISLLLSLSLFQLLLLELVPPTSITMPLIGEYILFTTVIVTLSVTCSVLVLNINFRSPTTHQLPQPVHKLFLDILPRLLFMQRPPHLEPSDEDDPEAQRDSSNYVNPCRKTFQQKPVHNADMNNVNYASTFVGFDPNHIDMSRFCQVGAKYI